MTKPTSTNFTQWLRDTGIIGPEVTTWVLARRTAAMVDRYPPNTRFFGQKEFDQLTERHRVALRDEQMLALMRRHELPVSTQWLAALSVMLTEAFEAGRKA